MPEPSVMPAPAATPDSQSSARLEYARQKVDPVSPAPDSSAWRAARKAPGEVSAAAPSGSAAASEASDGVGPSLAGADPDHRLDRHDPHLAVPDLLGAPGAHDNLDHGVDVLVGDHRLQPQLGDEVDGVLGAPVHLGVAPLAPEPLHLRDGHAGDAGGFQRLLDLVQLERLDHCGHQLHRPSMATG